MVKNCKLENAQKVLKGLKERYQSPATQLIYNSPWELLVAVQLAAQCTDARVNQVTPEFFRLWPGPDSLLEADPEEIERVIRPTGFFHNKAKNLLACAKMLVSKYGGKVPDTMEELVTLPGIARKTANCILFGAFGINEGIAVDTHVKRIAQRLGLTDNTMPVAIEKDLMEILPREEWGNFNIRMVEFGRDVCRAKKPACDACEFSSFCPCSAISV